MPVILALYDEPLVMNATPWNLVVDTPVAVGIGGNMLLITYPPLW
jgi:hypothetical protein